MPAKSKPPFRAKRGVHETPRPFVPVMSPRAAAARQRAMAFLAAGALSPFPDFRNVRNYGRGPWWGH
jgi:hypothetical protein